MSGELKCKCGHSKIIHGQFECDKCWCNEFTLVADTDDGWLDAPDLPGAWWRSFGSFMEVMNIKGDEEAWHKRHHPDSKWKRIEMPTPPAPKLPTSRQVTLTAKVCRPDGPSWCACVFIGGHQIYRAHWGGGESGKQAATNKIRDTYGIEPSVEGESE